MHEQFQRWKEVLRVGGVLFLEFPNFLSLTNILHDPHYQLFGVSVLPKALAAWYVVRFRHRSKTYEVGYFPIAFMLKRQFSRLQMKVVWKNPDLKRDLGILNPFISFSRENTSSVSSMGIPKRQ